MSRVKQRRKLRRAHEIMKTVAITFGVVVSIVVYIVTALVLMEMI